MRIAMLFDHDVAMREHRLIDRIVVALASEGQRIVRIVPQTVREDLAASGAPATVVIMPPAGPVTTRRQRAAIIAEAVREADRDAASAPNIVHVWSPRLVRVGAALASIWGAGLALEVWSTRASDAAARLKSSGVTPVCLVADPELARRMAARHPAIPLRTTPWGVHTPPAPRTLFAPGVRPALVIAGARGDVAGVGALLTGLKALVEQRPDALAFMDAGIARRSGAWALARRLNLTSNLSLIAQLEVNREPALQADALLVPGTAGEVRSIVLDAMAQGMAVLSPADASLSALSETGAMVPVVPSREGWTRALLELAHHPDEARRHAPGGWRYVREHRRASAHLQSVLDAYTWMTSADAVPFRAA